VPNVWLFFHTRLARTWWGQEPISEWSCEDDDDAEVEEGEVVVGFAVAAGADAAECFQPGVGAFDGPAVTGLWVAGFDASFFAAPDFAAALLGWDRVARSAWLADARADPALGECLFVGAWGVAAVGPEFVGLDADFGELVEQWQQVAPLVLVSGPEQDLERDPARLDYDVEAAAGRAPERARDLLAPFLASTSEASTITRDQSSLFASASCSCKTRIARWNKPRRDHSSKRRRHVSPLGKPSSR
jgi:hypothetical protein